uniref:Uncharacterized protein n=1 Tax=Ditylenchus dipsaci TaxID=166011 RepID=A0A915EUK2_9BILA
MELVCASLCSTMMSCLTMIWQARPFFPWLVYQTQSLSAKQLPLHWLCHFKCQPTSSTTSISSCSDPGAAKPERCLAKEMTAYEKYLRDYRILPPSAHDNKEEWSKGLKEVSVKWLVQTPTTQTGSRHHILDDKIIDLEFF